MNVLHDYLRTVTDPGHILAEATWEIATFLLTWPVAKWWVRKHDRKHHG